MTDRNPNVGNELRIEQDGLEVKLIFVCGNRAKADELARNILTQLKARARSEAERHADQHHGRTMITFRLTLHQVDNSDVVEIFDGAALVGVICVGAGLGSERAARAIRIISKFQQTVEQDSFAPGSTKVVFAK